ncbi:MAG: hypothetical protein OXB93_03460 [Cytophagales bacterium]|nr:hypothetical protein [Cytophagales bacterium]
MTNRELREHQSAFRRKSRYIRSLTSDSFPEESSAEQERRISRLLRPAHYGEFFMYYFGSSSGFSLGDAPCSPFHKRAYRKLLSDRLLTQFRLWFRGSAKSIQTNVGNVFALKCLGETRFMLLVGMNRARACLLLSDLQVQLQYNERIIRDFGNQVLHGNWREGAFETRDGSYFMSLGIEQPFRGLRRGSHRLDLVVVDDVEDRKKARNQRLIQERSEKILGDIGGAFSKDRRRLVISNNYMVKGGIIDCLSRHYKSRSHVNISRVNLSNSKGVPTWPAYYSRADISRISSQYDSYTLQREFYNRPVEEGRVLREEWIRFVELPDDFTHGGAVGYWDLSYKREGDYKAFALLGQWKTVYVVLDIFCQKTDITTALNWHYTRARDREASGCFSLYYYDATASQEAIFSPVLRDSSRGQEAHIPLPHRNAAIDKHLRIEATLTHAFFNRKIVFDQSISENPDTVVAVEQLLAFEKGGKSHDDFPDALENAFRICVEKYGAGTSSFRPVIGFRDRRRNY